MSNAVHMPVWMFGAICLVIFICGMYAGSGKPKV